MEHWRGAASDANCPQSESSSRVTWHHHFATCGVVLGITMKDTRKQLLNRILQGRVSSHAIHRMSQRNVHTGCSNSFILHGRKSATLGHLREVIEGMEGTIPAHHPRWWVSAAFCQPRQWCTEAKWELFEHLGCNPRSNIGPTPGASWKVAPWHHIQQWHHFRAWCHTPLKIFFKNLFLSLGGGQQSKGEAGDRLQIVIATQLQREKTTF